MSGCFFRSVLLDDGHFKEIQNVLEKEISETDKQTIQVICHEYLCPVTATTEGEGLSQDGSTHVIITPNIIKDQLQTIQKYCTSLHQAFQNVDDITYDLLLSCLVQSHPKTIKGISKLKPKARIIREDLNKRLLNEVENNYERLPKDLCLIEKAATQALENIGQQKGRTPDSKLNLLLCRLLQFYKEATDNKKVKGHLETLHL